MTWDELSVQRMQKLIGEMLKDAETEMMHAQKRIGLCKDMLNILINLKPLAKEPFVPENRGF